VMRVTPNFTSTTDFLLVDHVNITTGSAIGGNIADDNAWWVTPWRIAMAEGETPGEIGFQLSLPTVQTDVPGVLRGYFVVDKGSLPTLEVRVGDEQWHQVTATGSGPRPAAEFGRTYTQSGALAWNMRPVNQNAMTLEFLKFTPHAVEWLSPPFQLPGELQSQLLNFAVDTDDPEKWEAMHLEWRAGESTAEGGIDWNPWQSVSGWEAPLSSGEYLQLRILGVPLADEKPLIYNLRLNRQ